MKKEIKENYYIGIDWAIKPKWWQRLIVWFGFKKRWWDYSGAVAWKKEKDGTFKVIDKYDF